MLAACASRSGDAIPNDVAPYFAPVDAGRADYLRSLRTARLRPRSVTVSGRVARLAGPLSAAATAVTAPNVTATPEPGDAIRGAEVYLVDPSTMLVAPGIRPIKPLAAGLTDSAGRFTLRVPKSFAGTRVGIVAVKGDATPPAGGTVYNGVTSEGLTLAHAIVGATTAGASQSAAAAIVYLDTLTPDEQGAWVILNQQRKHAHLSPEYADTTAEMMARLLTAYAQAHDCKSPPNLPPLYAQVQGTLGDFSAEDDVFLASEDVTWFNLIGGSSTIGNVRNFVFGFHAIYQGRPCRGAPKSPRDYFSIVALGSNSP
jgi:hypothetical protein